MSTATPYVIQLSTNTNFCLGVTAPNLGAPVLLSLLHGSGSPLTQWYVDPTTGYITLAGSDPKNPLYLDIQGSSAENGNPLILTTLTLGRNFQRWNWVGNPPYVMNLGASAYCIDNDGGREKAGNKVQIYTPKNGNKNQQWQFLAVPVLKNALAVTA